MACLAFVIGSGGTGVAFSQESLTLDDTLKQVVEANLRLQVSSLDHDIALQRAKAEWAIFEPVFLVTVASEANKRQNNAEQFLSQRASVFDENNRIYSGAVEGILPTGGKVRIGSQVRGLDNNLQSAAGREYESYTGVTLTQPLLRERGWKSVAAQIRLATADSEIALQDYRGQLALVLSEAEMAYWELSAASEFVKLSEGSVKAAERILDDNKRRSQVGKITEIEITRAEAGVAIRRSHLAEAMQRKVDAAARLNAFLGRRTNQAPNILPLDSMEIVDTLPSLDEALDRGFQYHPAYLSQKARIEQAGIRLAYAKNERLPHVDLKASYGLNGLNDSIESSLDKSFGASYPSWYVGVEMRVPMLGGKRERHQLQAAKMRTQQSLLELSAIEIELVNGLQSLFDQVNSLRSRVSALQQVAELNQRVLQSEQEALEIGKGESRRVLQAEEDLSEASLEALSAEVEVRRAIAHFLVQQGTYLKERGFDLSETSEL